MATNGDRWLNPDELDRLEVSYKAGIREGRQEVVDWLINDSYETTIHFGEDWQDKLREWGIK